MTKSITKTYANITNLLKQTISLINMDSDNLKQEILTLRTTTENEQLKNFLHAVNFNFSDDRKLVILFYNLRFSRFFKDSMLTRGIIFDLADFSIVTLPFEKFYNVGEKNTTMKTLDKKLEKKTGYYVEKLDGSLINLSNYKGTVLVSTKGGLSRQKLTYNGEEVFSHVNSVYETYLTDGFTQAVLDNPNKTLLAELIVPDEPHIIDYSEKDYGLHLVGVRDNITGMKFTQPEVQAFSNQYDLNYVGYTEFTNTDSMVAFVESDDFKNKEGVVIYIGNDIYKFKRNDYNTSHKLHFYNLSVGNKNTVTNIFKLLFDMVKDETFDDYISKVQPDKKEQLTNMYQLIEERVAYFELLTEKELLPCQGMDKSQAHQYLREHSPEDVGKLHQIFRGNKVVNVYKNEILEYCIDKTYQPILDVIKKYPVITSDNLKQGKVALERNTKTLQDYLDTPVSDWDSVYVFKALRDKECQLTYGEDNFWTPEHIDFLINLMPKLDEKALEFSQFSQKIYDENPINFKEVTKRMNDKETDRVGLFYHELFALNMSWGTFKSAIIVNMAENLYRLNAITKEKMLDMIDNSLVDFRKWKLNK